jgi:uncharacterized protein (TIGR00299 family) protein
MKILYLDCFAGISGDMMVGALLNLGVPLDHLKKELSKLPLTNYDIRAKEVDRQNIAAIKLSVKAEEKGVVRTWPNVKNLIVESDLPDAVKDKSLEIFLKLAEAECKIHRKNLNQIHFHEVGAVDSIVDIVATVIGIEYLKVKKVFASEIATGMGMVKTEHGIFPVPSPATLEILKNVPIYSSNITSELTTPTGAAIVKTYVNDFGPLPPIAVDNIGYGAGSKELTIPNVLRILMGNLLQKHEDDELVVLETNIDDFNPEFYEFVMNKLTEKGALDVWMAPIYMKKNRPGVTFAILAQSGTEEELINLLFEETSTLGVRVSKVTRKKAERKIINVGTEYGKIAVKIADYKGKLTNISPEYRDCANIAHQKGVPIKKVYDAAKIAAEEKLASK